MFHLFEHLAKFTIASGTGTHCDDFVDRLNRKYTIYLLLLCCAIISSKQYVGDPLSCFAPSHFTGAHVEYTNNICWISNAYYVPIDDQFQLNDNSKEFHSGPFSGSSSFYQHNDDDDDKPNAPVRVVRVNNLIAYYPFLLLIQAIFFYIPYFLWKNIVNHSAYDVSTLINYAQETQMHEQGSESREKGLRYIVKHIDRAGHYYATKKYLKLNPRDYTTNSEADDEITVITETSKMHADDDYVETSSSEAVKRGNRNGHSKFDYDGRKKKSSLSQKYGKTQEKCLKLKKFFQIYIHNTLCEKFLFTLYLIIKLFYFTNSFGQLLLLNKLITGDTNSIQRLLSTLANQNNNNNGGASNFGNSDNMFQNQHQQQQQKLLQSIFTISNKNDILFIQQKVDNDNYFLMASNNIWTGFEFGYKTIINLIQTGSLFSRNTRLLIFHSVIFCDFRIRVLGDRLHKHTVQCVAPINIFSEKLFTLIWFWFLILSIINAYNLIEWLNFFMFSKIRYNFVLNYFNQIFANNSKRRQEASSSSLAAESPKLAARLNTNGKKLNGSRNGGSAHLLGASSSLQNDNRSVFANGHRKISTIKQSLDKDITKKLVKTYLELDNLFIVRLIAKNSNEIITQELITVLLDYYQNKNSIINENDAALNGIVIDNANVNDGKKSINL